MAKLKIKQGATLDRSLRYTTSAGAPVDITGYGITSQIRDGVGVLLATLAFTVNPDQSGHKGEFTINDTDTSDWPTGSYLCDIFFTQGSKVRPTETFEIHVTKRQTQL